MSNVFNNWCPEIYRSVYIVRHNDDYVNVAPCCFAASQLEPTDTFDFYNSPYLNQLREEFNQGLQPKACNACWKLESHGHKSRRRSAIEFYKDTSIDTTVQLQCIDHSATWACNLACIMCGPINSSFWASQDDLSKNDLIQLGRMFQKSNNFLKNIDLSNIKKIHFNGGEPMLNNDQTDLLLKLEQQGVLQDVFISYNTNGTVMPSKKTIELWSKSKLIKIFFSIDAVGSAFEYIRWPAKWKQVNENIASMKADLPHNVMFGCNTTVGNYNLLEMVDLYHWFEQNISHNRYGDASDFCWQFSLGFDLCNLPLAARNAAIEQLQNLPAFDGLVSYVKSTLQHQGNLNWINKLQALDVKRNTDWKTALAVSKFIKETTC